MTEEQQAIVSRYNRYYREKEEIESYNRWRSIIFWTVYIGGGIFVIPPMYFFFVIGAFIWFGVVELIMIKTYGPWKDEPEPYR